jgi:hypothetical protein
MPSSVVSPGMRLLAALLLLTACAAASARAPAPDAGADLGGRVWHLVKFQSCDETTLTPDDRTKYTFEFGGVELTTTDIFA